MDLRTFNTARPDSVRTIPSHLFEARQDVQGKVALQRFFLGDLCEALASRQLIRECLALQENLRATVEAKRVALEAFLGDLDARIARARGYLAGHDPA